MRLEVTRTLLVRPSWGEGVPSVERSVDQAATRYRGGSSAGYVPTPSHRFGR
jgi:hypothetical protein